MSEIIQKARVLSGFRGDLSGEIYETMVVSEIIKWMKTVQRQEEIYFYRTRSGLELDPPSDRKGDHWNGDKGPDGRGIGGSKGDAGGGERGW
jgi:hypothetical protein